MHCPWPPTVRCHLSPAEQTLTLAGLRSAAAAAAAAAEGGRGGGAPSGVRRERARAVYVARVQRRSFGGGPPVTCPSRIMPYASCLMHHASCVAHASGRTMQGLEIRVKLLTRVLAQPGRCAPK
jgi:hypothetical protein